ncbi:hypothetical protein FGO68_gene13795 [Halteria grandinella]|uniref:Uncharacterized protein n=1 Tax=Halteria grandinella TaxID=5974 RepID=A0A8J8SUM2_HALGN|nr:hypothetical protein FGO68_gene13795 [Halteria grandinella]
MIIFPKQEKSQNTLVSFWRVFFVFAITIIRAKKSPIILLAKTVLFQISKNLMRKQQQLITSKLQPIVKCQCSLKKIGTKFQIQFWIGIRFQLKQHTNVQPKRWTEEVHWFRKTELPVTFHSSKNIQCLSIVFRFHWSLRTWALRNNR